MKRWFTGVIAALLSGAAPAADLAVTFDNNNRVKITQNNADLFVNDNLVLFDKDWKTVLSPMSGKPEIVKADNVATSVWKTAQSTVTRSVDTAAPGKIAVTWEVELAANLNAAFVELTMIGVANNLGEIKPNGKKDIYSSKHGFPVPLKDGELVLNFKGSQNGWVLEDMRNTSWIKNLRLWQFRGYDNQGMKFTAKITFGGDKSEIEVPAAARTGAGAEYDNTQVALEPQVTEGMLPAGLKVDTAKVVRLYDHKLFGLCNDWPGLTRLTVFDGKAYEPGMKANSDYLTALKGLRLPAVRMAGTDSQYFQWKKALGPMVNREAQKNGQWGAAVPQPVGVVEWIASSRQLDPEAQFVWVFNMTGDTAQDAADLAEFLTGSADTVWGKKRIALGLKEPVTPIVWELGNELDWGKDPMPAAEYIAKCKEWIAAVRKVEPAAKFAAHSITAPWDKRQLAKWEDWNQSVLNALGKDLSYYAFHPYYRGHSPGYLKKYLDDLSNFVKNSPNPDIKIFISEHAKWPPNAEKGDAEWKKYWYQTHALTGCLDTAEWDIMSLSRPEIGMMTYHNICSGPWGFVYPDGNGKYFATGLGDLYRLFTSIPDGAKVVETSLSGPHTSITGENFSLSAAAVKDQDTLYLLINNRLPTTEREIALDLGKPYTLIKSQTLSAPNILSANSRASREISVKTETFAQPGVAKVTVPPKSFVILTLKP